MAGLFPNGGICAVVVGRRAAEMQRALRLALRHARTIELRLDWLRGDAEIERMIRWIDGNRRKLGTGSRVTLIATCRRVQAGGKFRGSVARQIGLLRGAARAINAAKREITPRFHRIFTAFDVSDFTESYTK